MRSKRKGLAVSLLAIAVAAAVAGCGGNAGGEKQPVAVNTYKIIAEDTIVPAEYSGVVAATDKVAVMPKVYGRVLE